VTQVVDYELETKKHFSITTVSGSQ
jgi:hypothetical protein